MFTAEELQDTRVGCAQGEQAARVLDLHGVLGLESVAEFTEKTLGLLLWGRFAGPQRKLCESLLVDCL